VDRDYSERLGAHSAAAVELATEIRELGRDVIALSLWYEALPWWRPLQRRRALRELAVLGNDIERLRGEFAEEAGRGLAAAARAIWAYVPVEREKAL
jgi:hypothetical protein